jgi:hypothetical protein
MMGGFFFFDSIDLGDGDLETRIQLNEIFG